MLTSNPIGAADDTPYLRCWRPALALLAALAWLVAPPLGDQAEARPTMASVSAGRLQVRTTGASLYVDGRTGRNGASGSASDPMRTINEAMRRAAPGTTVLVRGGVYDVPVEVRNIRGRADAWIVVKPHPGERVEIVAGGEWANAIRIDTSSYVSVEGFRLTGRADSVHGSGVRVDSDSSDVRVAGNDIQGFGGSGISYTRSDRAIIEDNVIRDVTMRSDYATSAINMWQTRGPGTSSGFASVIRNNLVISARNERPNRATGAYTDGNCVIIDMGRANGYRGWTLIENNICVGNGGRGIHAFHSDRVVARSNTLIHNVRTPQLSTAAELSANNSSDIVFANNLVLNTADRVGFMSWRSSNVTFEGNAIAHGPLPPGSNWRVNPTGTLVGPFGSIDLAAYRPVDRSPVLGRAVGAQRAPLDARQRVRPSSPAVGALER